ncbi:MAG: DUF6391 domain-containing protein [Anaerolineaceae bacterium]|nr:DUF6391 domain-containing protein [Anaerolineaceae bacterium]
MSLLETLQSAIPVGQVRRNHAMEHATLHMLTKKKNSQFFAGHADHRGFRIFGNATTEEVHEAVEEALVRLRAGEKRLAVHPNCGTNFVVSGIMAGCAAWLGMLGTESSFRRKLDRLPIIIMVTTLVLIYSRALGPLMQEHLTTNAKIGNLQVIEIMRHDRGRAIIHRIRTHN